jgi:hypothetical protein
MALYLELNHGDFFSYLATQEALAEDWIRDTTWDLLVYKQRRSSN